MSERTPHCRTDNVWAKCFKSQKWEGKHGALKMHLCVGWCVNRNSLWCYTMLPAYNFIEWMIIMIATVGLWCHCNIIWIRPDIYIFWTVQYLKLCDVAFVIFIENSTKRMWTDVICRMFLHQRKSLILTHFFFVFHLQNKLKFTLKFLSSWHFKILVEDINTKFLIYETIISVHLLLSSNLKTKQNQGTFHYFKTLS
jgi:hypothetical protein